MLSRPYRLEASAAFNRESYLKSLLQTDLSLGSLAPEVRSFDDSDVRSKASIPLRHDCYDDTHFDDLEVSSDPSLRFESPLKTSTPLDTSEDVPIIPDPSLPWLP